jgi:hypothetical protein
MVAAVLHLMIAAGWLGSMAYSLLVVQPRVTRFFTDEGSREEFLLTLAHGNRRPVLAVVTALGITALLTMATWPSVAPAYGIAFVPYAAATAIFANVSWRHWPARVFALPSELPGYRRRLRLQAWTMLVLVAAAFVLTLSASIAVT